MPTVTETVSLMSAVPLPPLSKQRIEVNDAQESVEQKVDDISIVGVKSGAPKLIPATVRLEPPVEGALGGDVRLTTGPRIRQLEKR